MHEWSPKLSNGLTSNRAFHDTMTHAGERGVEGTGGGRCWSLPQRVQSPLELILGNPGTIRDLSRPFLPSVAGWSLDNDPGTWRSHFLGREGWRAARLTQNGLRGQDQGCGGLLGRVHWGKQVNPNTSPCSPTRVGWT